MSLRDNEYWNLREKHQEKLFWEKLKLKFKMLTRISFYKPFAN